MGATNFKTTIIGKFKNEKEAYNAACEEAVSYYGHQEGYNGTISTTSGVKLSSDAPKYGSFLFNEWEDAQLDILRKYGHCLAIEIKGSKFAAMKTNAGLKGKKGIKAYVFIGIASC